MPANSEEQVAKMGAVLALDRQYETSEKYCLEFCFILTGLQIMKLRGQVIYSNNI